MKTKIVFIEGNISSGKTTLINALKDKYTVYEEPLEEWLTEYKLGDRNILELFYSNMRKYGFKFEIMSMVSRFNQFIRALTELNNDNIIFIERSYNSCRRVFAQNLYNEGLLDELEWLIYIRAHRMFSQLMEMVLRDYCVSTVYIRTSPDECFKRKIGRDRIEEADVAPKYFSQLHDLHDQWLMETAIIINGDKKGDEVLREVLSKST